MDPVIIIIGSIGAIVIFINPFVGLLTTIALIPQSLLSALSNMLFGAFTMVTPIKIIGGITFISVVIKNLFERNKWDFLKKAQTKYFILFLTR